MGEYAHLIELVIFFAALLAVFIPMQLQQGARTDRLYEMFIELVKNNKKK
jgi:hypothetical protein